MPYRDPVKKAAKKVRDRERDMRLRKAALAYLGGSCVRCGFSDPRALQIDHIDGGGRAEHRVIGGRGISKKVLDGAEGYQLLCANCNWIKRHENGEWRRR